MYHFVYSLQVSNLHSFRSLQIQSSMFDVFLSDPHYPLQIKQTITSNLRGCAYAFSCAPIRTSRVHPATQQIVQRRLNLRAPPPLNPHSRLRSLRLCAILIIDAHHPMSVRIVLHHSFFFISSATISHSSQRLILISCRVSTMYRRSLLKASNADCKLICTIYTCSDQLY